MVDRTNASAEREEVFMTRVTVWGSLTIRHYEDVTVWESSTGRRKHVDQVSWRTDYFVPKSDTDICACVHKPYQSIWK
jgi:hypothetical protein